MHYNTAGLSMVKNDWVLVETSIQEFLRNPFIPCNIFIIKGLDGINRRVIGTVGKVPICSYMQYYSEFETRTPNLGPQV